ncbi:hypothetical protein [Streptomyces sp. NPDC089799]|uniref:hypothetical protein n=1 Tax=Streptomyces sp. NPDC089799 TaxID=3155066 RepID=UPI00341480E3
MNDSPGWASPGSDPSEGDRPQQPAQPDRSGDPGRTAQPGEPGTKWSAEQPPAGSGTPRDGVWGNPGAGQTPPPSSTPQPGTGWGSYGGRPGQTPSGSPYGAPGGWGKPPAAKPGVIPLRPLGLGEILDGAVTTMRTHWRSVLPITLAVAVLIEIISLTLQRTVLSGYAVVPDESATPEEAFKALGDSMVVSMADSFIQLVGSVIVTALLMMVFSRAVLGRPSSVGDAWREARPHLLKLAGLTLLLMAGALAIAVVLMLPGALLDSAGLVALGAIGALVLIAWLWVKFALAAPALMLERGGVVTSLRRSAKLVRGAWWRIFGISVLTSLITGFVAMMIVSAFAVVGSLFTDEGVSGFVEGTSTDSWAFLIIAGIGAVIALTIVMPMQAGVTALLYIDQRIRREALDLELARAAGVEGYGTTPGTAPPATGS